MRADCSRATALATLVLVTRPRTSCQRASRRLPRQKRCGRIMHRPRRIGGRPGESLEQSLEGGCWHSGRFVRDASDRPGGSPAASMGDLLVCACSVRPELREHSRSHLAEIFSYKIQFLFSRCSVSHVLSSASRSRRAYRAPSTYRTEAPRLAQPSTVCCSDSNWRSRRLAERPLRACARHAAVGPDAYLAAPQGERRLLVASSPSAPQLLGSRRRRRRSVVRASGSGSWSGLRESWRWPRARMHARVNARTAVALGSHEAAWERREGRRGKSEGSPRASPPPSRACAMGEDTEQ